jgi:WhiB family transcriptional regulator, redox-sensing transcriptional regulator
VVSDDHRDELVERVRRLRRLRDVPDAVLIDVVWQNGCCVGRFLDGHSPPFAECEQADDPDWALVRYLCAGCPVADHCLELELRIAGEDTVGVFGCTSEDERREMYRLWLDDRNGPPEESEGGQSLWR